MNLSGLKHGIEKDFGAQMQAARTVGLGMRVEHTCDVCGGLRSQGNHRKCSKIRQQRGFNK